MKNKLDDMNRLKLVRCTVNGTFLKRYLKLLPKNALFKTENTKYVKYLNKYICAENVKLY